ncbi:MAG: dihydroorotate dehydrogenase electron transfer subunit [Actinobacteria bacterium]|nr:dihydroorotate dehydrogenase electron transfer subunit [Actinomycetota bacterium]
MTVDAAVSATTGTLIATRPAGRYHRCSIAAPDVATAAVPGQFVAVEVQAPGTLLRRPFAIAGVDTAAGVLHLVVATVGAGSAWLVAQAVSTRLRLTGPLGRGFTMPADPGRCLLVGGGYGVAALEWLGARLLAAGHRVELLSGAATAQALYPVTRHDTVAGTVVETTEDGSSGQRGLVTDALGDRLRDGDAMVYACGPMPMLAAVAGITRRAGMTCEVAVEEHMGCSVGVCMTCVVPTVHGYARSCIDGPVMDASRIRWESVDPPREDGLRHG